MKILKVFLLLLPYYITAIFAKGGGGGRGGRGGGGRIGFPRPGWGGSRPGWSGGSRPGRVIGSPGKISRGGSGFFSEKRPPPTSYTNTRTTYTNYHPVYNGGYTSTSRYGYSGFYNPGLTYWSITPSFFFLGYYSAYHRYHPITGYYYAPEITYQGGNTHNVIINGTANSGDYGDNYHYSFNISTNNQYAMADHAFYSSSDPNAHAADFAYRLEFTHVIEFEDKNDNGFYDDNEEIVSITSLGGLQWEVLSVENTTVPTNQSQFYIETKTAATAVYNSTMGNPSFDIEITWRTSNLQLNHTAPIVIQPNSLQYDVSLKNYPSSNKRLAIGQLLSTLPNESIAFDVNITTPIDIANQIKTNLTYGISIGNYTQGRLEYQPTVNITNIANVSGSWIDLDPTKIANSSYYNNNDWIWGSIAPSTRKSNLVFITIPKTDTMAYSISGFGFLDTDVMGAMVNEASESFFDYKIYVLLGMLMIIYLVKQRSSSKGYVPIQ